MEKLAERTAITNENFTSLAQVSLLPSNNHFIVRKN